MMALLITKKCILQELYIHCISPIIFFLDPTLPQVSAVYRRNHSSHETHETRENTEVSCFFSLARLQNFSFLINFSLNKKPLGRLDLFSNFLIMAVPLFVCCVVLTKFNLAFFCLGETFSLTWPNAQDFVGN